MNLSGPEIAEIPEGVVIMISNEPTEPAGDVVVIVVPVLVTIGAALPLKLTAVAPEKSVPVMVTAVPPAVGPVAGEIPVTAGGEIYVN